MRILAEKQKATQQTKSTKFTVPCRAHFEHTGDFTGDLISTGIPPFGHDLSKIPVFAKTPTERAVPNIKKESVESSDVKVQGVRTFKFNFNGLNSAPHVTDSVAVSEKSVEGGEQNFFGDHIVERAPKRDNRIGATPGGSTSIAFPKIRKAGVDSFEVKWSINSRSTETDPKLRLDYKAKFMMDDDHDPALAEFRQNAMTTYTIIAVPYVGQRGTTAPMHDDHYSRADDLSGNTITDVDFKSNDNPGYNGLVRGAVFDYSFTAEQMIIDRSQNNKVIEKRGPHTATIKGRHPWIYGGVPYTLS
jgi:hypothetical protein